MSLPAQPLSPAQLRVLGALLEKEITTPEYYPLSLNALLNACNQRSSRDPVLELSQSEVLSALDDLEAMEFTAAVRDGRVTKYEHRIRTVLQLRRDEAALLCLLLLRGPQTPGELRSRADRLYAFDDLPAVSATLDRLASRPRPGDEGAGTGPLTAVLPRQPGARESRYAHLLGGGVDGVPAEARHRPDDAGGGSGEPLEQTVSRLVETVRLLEDRIAALEAAAGAPGPHDGPPVE